jgi:hypothetical protein
MSAGAAVELAERVSRLEKRLHEYEQLEELRSLRMRYCRFVDEKLWDALEQILTLDFVLHSHNHVDGERSPVPVAASARAFRERLERISAGATTVHVCAMPEITIEAPTAARATWAMTDIVSHPTDPGLRWVGHGHYHDEYRLGADGVWRIAKATLTRQRLDPLPVLEAERVVGQPAGPAAG